MKLAILSDIHGNLHAIREVLRDIDAQGVDEIINLGDTVGYGPDPNECLALTRERGFVNVLGNHEHGLLKERHRIWFNEQPRVAVEITAKLLTPENFEYISQLPRAIVRHDLRFVHGYPPDSPYYYLVGADDAKLHKTFAKMKQDICFVGHTHLLELVTEKDGEPDRWPIGEGEHQLHAGQKYIINVGSVGQPRDDFNTKAKYVLFDTETLTLTVRFIAYDAKPVAEKMLEQGVPETFAKRLLS
ncbi:metallophosphoesterase family protein [Desulfobaculum bizertense]|uniref:Predicted phosphodiesterase n=1 Tax=Desulfobaculum bizertense DSM 18034 TaxID=1121442 RepID=A0A1T4WIV7_9BACT|nr:metallophosphoesterase family protein [Desulfobaculum bizertense]UIJ37155.1 metallophosphatase family protein [Desulfobaculum bizertense]SKA77260.1 Predicted phosphodiesterase [Desulfobaculum bizertense DSM 18034]